MRTELVALLLLLLPAVGHAADIDPLCDPLRAFVGSVGPEAKHELVFRTSWGANFKDETGPAIYAKRCEHGGYEPAGPACKALVEEGVTEFSGRNVQRVLECLSPKTRFGRGLQLSEGRFSLEYGTPDRGSFVTIDFHADEAIGGMALRIAVDGY
jgi:hypothetical protein